MKTNMSLAFVSPVSITVLFLQQEVLGCFLEAIHERCFFLLRKDRRCDGSSVVRSTVSTFLTDYMEVYFCCVVTVVAQYPNLLVTVI